MTRLIAIALAVSAAAAAERPDVLVTLPDAGPRPGVPYPVEYIVSWEGPADAYLVQPVEIGALDWGAARVIQSRTARAKDVTQVTQTVEYVADAAGLFTLPNALIPIAESAEELGGAVSLVLEAETPEIAVRKPVPWLPIAAGVGAVALLAVGAVAWRRSRSGPEGGNDDADVEAALHRCRRLRLDGDYYGFYRELTKLAESLKDVEEAPALAETYRLRASEVGYQGVQPTEDTLNGDLRDLERIVGRWKKEQVA